jgi:hypothetical protein
MIVFFSSAFSASEDRALDLNDQELAHLCKMQDASILSIADEGKVYLDSSKISMKREGIVLYAQTGGCFRIPCLFSDEKGCFVKTDSREIVCWFCGLQFRTYQREVKCPGCGMKNQ